MANLVLASSSPRRRELLAQLGLEFSIACPNIDESVKQHEVVQAYVERLACEKAAIVLAQDSNKIVLAADTSVSVDGEILTKPQSKADAFRIWHAISGRKHDVFTGVCVRTLEEKYSIVVHTEVEFQRLSPKDMEDYWATGEPVGKAGAYAIQGIAARYIPSIHGSYSNVVGLPLHETVKLLQAVKALN